MKRASPEISVARRAIIVGIAVFAFAATAAAQVTITDAWVRGMVPGQATTGAYMRIQSAKDTALVGVSSPVAQIAEIHEMKLDAGLMTMRAHPKLAIGAGRTVELQPSGAHVMMMGVGRTLAAGDTVALTLEFVDADGRKRKMDLKVPVLPIAATGPAPAIKP